MPRSIAALMAAASPKGKRRAGLVPRHDIEGLPRARCNFSIGRPILPVQTWCSMTSAVMRCGTTLRCHPGSRREIREDMPLLAFDTFAERIFDPDDLSADASGWRPPDWRRDYYPTADGRGLQHGVSFLYDKFSAHGRPVSAR